MIDYPGIENKKPGSPYGSAAGEYFTLTKIICPTWNPVIHQYPTQAVDHVLYTIDYAKNRTTRFTSACLSIISSF